MHRTKIVRLSILALLLLAGSILAFVFYKINRLENDLEDLRISNFHIKAENPRLSLLKGQLLSDKIQISGYLGKDSIYVTTRRLNVEGMDMIPFLVKNEILVNNIEIDSSLVILKAVNTKLKKKKKAFGKRKLKQVQVRNLKLYQGKFYRTSLEKDTLISAYYNILLNNTSFDPSIQPFPVPKAYEVEMEDVKIDMDALNELRISSIQLDTSKWSLSTIQLIPKYNKKQYSQHLSKQKDRIALSSDSIVIHNPEYPKDTASIWKSSFIKINQLQTDIFRDKTLPPDLSYRPMISKMLRTLPIKFEIDSLRLKTGSITYGELLKNKDKAGEITITNTDLKITGLNNTIKDTLDLTFTGSFMDQGELYIHSKIPVWDTNDNFITNIYLNNLDTKRLDVFTSPNLQVRNTGFIKNAVFRINGNENKARGSVVMSYKDLQIRVMNKEGSKEKKLWSSIANALIRKENKDLKQQEFEVKRTKSKSYFNYLWLCVQKGLITSMTY